MNWTFFVPAYEGLDLKYTIEESDVAYIPDLPNNPVVKHILLHVLDAYNPWIHHVSYDVTLLCNLQSINHKWRWLISS